MEALFKIGREVVDRWFPELGKGKVVKATAVVTTVKFPHEKRSYFPREFLYLQEIKKPEAIKWKS